MRVDVKNLTRLRKEKKRRAAEGVAEQGREGTSASPPKSRKKKTTFGPKRPKIAAKDPSTARTASRPEAAASASDSPAKDSHPDDVTFAPN